MSHASTRLYSARFPNLRGNDALALFDALHPVVTPGYFDRLNQGPLTDMWL